MRKNGSGTVFPVLLGSEGNGDDVAMLKMTYLQLCDGNDDGVDMVKLTPL